MADKVNLVCGFGVNDANYAVRPRDGAGFKICKAYSSWHNMISRVHGKAKSKLCPTYSDVSVCEQWRSFSRFKSWWVNNYVDGWHLDKDILTDGASTGATTMKLTKSKQFLADAIHVSGKGWAEGANWAAQDKTDGLCEDNSICFFSGPDKPVCTGATRMWRCGAPESAFMGYCRSVKCTKLSPNWHQTVLSREEYFSAYPETVEQVADADGWIEWSGVAKSPVSKGVVVDVKMKNGTQHFGQLMDDECLGDHWGDASIIAYRLHKPEQSKQEFCESVMRSIPEPDEQVWTNPPTIEQLAADYRNASDYADRKQQEADDAKADADEKLKALEFAGEALGLLVAPITAKQGPELVITDWRDLQLNDIIEYVDGSIKDNIGMTGPVVEFAPDATDGMMVRMKCDNGPRKGSLGWPMKWRFIRRP